MDLWNSHNRLVEYFRSFRLVTSFLCSEYSKFDGKIVNFDDFVAESQKTDTYSIRVMTPRNDLFVRRKIVCEQAYFIMDIHCQLVS